MTGDVRDKVVPLSGYRTNMRFPLIAEVRAYWEALRDGRPVPFRSEVDPRGIERALEFAFILERIAPQVARFRLAGMHLNDLMGMEVRGMPMTAFFTPPSRTRVAEILEAVFSEVQTAELNLTAETGFGKPSLDAAVVILPLKSDLGDVSRALGCLISDGAIGRAPRRFELAEYALRSIETGPRTQTSEPSRHGFAESASVYSMPKQGRPRRRDHLRLVVSDE